MKIGVLVATYNGEKYIKEQIDSIYNQTIKVDEIIVSDDNSTDNTVDVLKSYYNKDTNIDFKVVVNEGEHGVLRNFENAFRNSSADILFFADQDDKWMNNKVELFVKAMQQYPDCGCFFSDAYITDGNLMTTGATAWDVFFPDGKSFDTYAILDKDFIAKRLVRGNIITGMCMAVRREILENVFPINRFLLHDEAIAMYCAINNSIVAINKETAYYRQHNDNVVGLVSRFNSEETRRNSIYGLVKYSYCNLPDINFMYYKSEFYNNCDQDNQYNFISEFYRFMKKRYEYAHDNKFKASLKYFSLFIKNDYSRNLSNKYFILDLAMTLFVNTKSRRKFFDEL